MTIAIFENNKFCTVVTNKADSMKYQVESKYMLYEIDFSDIKNIDGYEFILDVEGNVRWFVKYFTTAPGFRKTPIWQRIKFLFLGRY